MSNADRIRKFMTDHGVDKTEIWQVPGGKSYAVYHHVLERIAYQNMIKFDPPTIIEANGAEGVVSMLVTGRLGDFSEWSIGEASPRNNKNAYCWAMAEKRAKDRVILKLLNIHGVVYSDAEFDEAPRNTNQQAAPQKKSVEPNTAEERSESEVQAFKTCTDMLNTSPTVKALDTLMKSSTWVHMLETCHEQDKPALRKLYAERRETLTYKEAA